jgi:hypothetical protein
MATPEKLITLDNKNLNYDNDSDEDSNDGNDGDASSVIGYNVDSFENQNATSGGLDVNSGSDPNSQIAQQTASPVSNQPDQKTLNQLQQDKQKALAQQQIAFIHQQKQLQLQQQLQQNQPPNSNLNLNYTTQLQNPTSQTQASMFNPSVDPYSFINQSSSTSQGKKKAADPNLISSNSSSFGGSGFNNPSFSFNPGFPNPNNQQSGISNFQNKYNNAGFGSNTGPTFNFQTNSNGLDFDSENFLTSLIRGGRVVKNMVQTLDFFNTFYSTGSGSSGVLNAYWTRNMYEKFVLGAKEMKLNMRANGNRANIVYQGQKLYSVLVGEEKVSIRSDVSKRILTYPDFLACISLKAFFSGQAKDYPAAPLGAGIMCSYKQYSDQGWQVFGHGGIASVANFFKLYDEQHNDRTSGPRIVDLIVMGYLMDIAARGTQDNDKYENATVVSICRTTGADPKILQEVKPGVWSVSHSASRALSAADEMQKTLDSIIGSNNIQIPLPSKIKNNVNQSSYASGSNTSKTTGLSKYG